MNIASPVVSFVDLRKWKWNFVLTTNLCDEHLSTDNHLVNYNVIFRQRLTGETNKHV